MAPIVRLEECTIVWLCPLEIELRAAIMMLDAVSSEIPTRSQGQNVVYTIGKIGHHKVAIVGYYQEQGLAASGSMTAEVMRDLPNLEIGLLVGVAGGIPSPGRDIRLGDVVVAVPEANHPGVVGYDLGKVNEDGTFELKHWQHATHPLLRSVINVVRARNQIAFWKHLAILNQQPEFQRPATASSSQDASKSQSLTRLDLPSVHYGTILSGNSVIKSRSHRDHLANKYGGIAVEMEAAGILTKLPVAVIRGISDFADATKTKPWQPYAAISAAAYAKEVLLQLPVSRKRNSDVSTGMFTHQDVHLAQAFPEPWAFVGRDQELSYLQDTLGVSVQSSLRKVVVALWGLQGIGKSQLASKFVSMQRVKHPDRDLFWISGANREAFEQSIISLYRSGSHSSSTGHTSTHEQRATLIVSFYNELNNMQDSRWLLVIDDVSGRSSSDDFDIHQCVERLKRGCILVISDRRDIVERYHLKYKVEGLSTHDAVELLQSQIDNKLIQAADLEEVASTLRGFPLSLRVAISIISRYRYTTTEYLKIWTGGGMYDKRYDADKGLIQSLHLSFDELERSNPIAMKLLILFAFLDHRDLWYELCLDYANDALSELLGELPVHRRPFSDFYPELADLSFIELKFTPDGKQRWETHPAIQAIAQRRAANSKEQYIRCAVSLVAAAVPRSYEDEFWERTKRLEPHANYCWRYIKQGRTGQGVNPQELDSLARLFRHLGRSELASEIYRTMERAVRAQKPNPALALFLADVYTNLGLTLTSLRDLEAALEAFQRSWDIRTQLGTLTPDAAMSILYNKSIVFTMMGKLEGAETYLKQAAAHFGQPQSERDTLSSHERKRLYVRILNDLGEVYLLQDSTQQAMGIFSYLLSTQISKLGESHPTIVSIKLNLARGHTNLKEFARSHSLLEEVIALYTNWWGRRHCDTMRAVEELALTCMKEGEQMVANGEAADVQFQKAEEIWNEILECYRALYGARFEAVDRVSRNLQYLATIRNT